ncbi:MAG: murein L,D-transpeptidase YcbB/YkuD [Myxococcota bacterium]|jgi:murein L,D-transpeptidase YcbB/YkuD
MSGSQVNQEKAKVADSSASLLPIAPERLVGIGVAGLFVGLVVGALAFRDANAPHGQPSAEAAAVQAPRAAAAAKAPKEPGKAGAAAGAAGAKTPDPKADPEEAPIVLPPKKGMSENLALAVADDKWFLPLRQELHETLGTGALFANGGPTQAGKWLMARVDALESHAVPTGPYEALGVSSALRAARDTDNEMVIARAEAALGRALLRLVLDWRFIKKLGPGRTDLVSEKWLAKHERVHRRILKVAIDVASASSEAEATAYLDPPHPNYQPMLKALAEYRGYAAASCPRLDPSLKIRPGAKGRFVERLQKRLRCEGLYSGPINGVYDETTKAGAIAYQVAHEQGDDGLVFAGTIRSMNVPLTRRVEQIELALQRLRESKVWEMPDFYLSVNIPSFEMEAVHNGEIVRRHKVITGSNRLDDDKLNLVQGHLNRTQLFTTRLTRVIVNPAWILPDRISKGELKGKIADDPTYLEKANIKEKTLANGRKVLIQGFGPSNVLGKVKFILEKSNAIFLHDTDKKLLFRELKRDYSHGCVRVHKAVEFAEWLLHRDGFSEKEIGRAFKLTKRQRGMDLAKPVHLMTEYVTVDLTIEGRPMFLTDVYGYDKAVAQNRLPPRTKIRWGDPVLRPSWVPLVPKETVNAWRRSGKPAPRNYDPAKDG